MSTILLKAGIVRDDDNPCPLCGCPFMTERTVLASGPITAHYSEDLDDWVCGHLNEVTVYACVGHGCNYECQIMYSNGLFIKEAPVRVTIEWPEEETDEAEDVGEE